MTDATPTPAEDEPTSSLDSKETVRSLRSQALSYAQNTANRAEGEEVLVAAGKIAKFLQIQDEAVRTIRLNSLSFAQQFPKDGSTFVDRAKEFASFLNGE